MKILRITVISLLALTLAACAGTRPEPPQVQLAGLEISDVSLSHANFLANLRLYNPNSVSLDIEGIAFTLFLNNVRIANGRTGKPLTIAAEDSGLAAIRLSSSYLELFQLTRGLQGREEVTFRIAGEIRIGGHGFLGTSVPIDGEGTLPLAGSLDRLRPGKHPLFPLEQLGNPPAQ